MQSFHSRINVHIEEICWVVFFSDFRQVQILCTNKKEGVCKIKVFQKNHFVKKKESNLSKNNENQRTQFCYLRKIFYYIQQNFFPIKGNV